MDCNYFYSDNFFLESFDSGERNTSILNIANEKSILFVLSLDYTILQFISDLNLNLEFLQILKEIKNHFQEIEKPLFIAKIDYLKKKLSYINFNSNFLFIKKVNEKLKLIENSNNFLNITTIFLDELELLYILNNEACAKYFEQNCENLFFVKDIIKHFYTKKENVNFSFIFLNALLPKTSNTTYHYSIKAKKENIHKLEDEIEEVLNSQFSNIEKVSDAVTILNELLLNSYEHGALKIDSEKKQKLIEEYMFEDYTNELEENLNEELEVELSLYDNFILKVSIKDNGNGFDYSKLHNTNHNEYRGRGLLISKKLSEALFFSENGKVSTFFVRLAKIIEDIDINDPYFYTKKMSILYVEDDKLIREVFSRILKKYTQTLFVAENGLNGLNIYEQFEPDIIITDIEMPIMNGLEMSAKIRESDNDIPIILTTAYNDEKIFLEAIDIGVDKFLIKPIEMPKLQKSVFKIAKDVYLKNEAKKRFAIEKRLKAKELRELQIKNKYITLAQQAAFEKEKLIIKDDSKELNIECKIYYKPLEILSGDIYGVCKINDKCTLFYIIDSMGKGLSAAVTATLSAAFINRAIVISTGKNSFALDKLIYDYSEYIKSYLLEYESVSLSFILLNELDYNIKHTTFGMYPILIKDIESAKLVKIKSNNPPLTKHLDVYNIEKVTLPKSFSLMFYSDGIIEHEEFSLSDLKESFLKRESFEEIRIDFESSFKDENFAYEDDVSAIFITNNH